MKLFGYLHLDPTADNPADIVAPQIEQASKCSAPLPLDISEQFVLQRLVFLMGVCRRPPCPGQAGGIVTIPSRKPAPVTSRR